MDKLNEKEKTESFSESEWKLLSKTARSYDNGVRYHVLQIISNHPRQSKAYNLVKDMTEDSCSYVSKMAIQLLVNYGKKEDYVYLLELAKKGNEQQRFFAFYYLKYLVYELDLDEEKWLQDVEAVTKIYPDKLTKFGFLMTQFFSTWNLKYLYKIGTYLYDSSRFIRIWTINILEDILDLLEREEEEVEIIRDLLYCKLKKEIPFEKYVFLWIGHIVVCVENFISKIVVKEILRKNLRQQKNMKM